MEKRRLGHIGSDENRPKTRAGKRLVVSEVKSFDGSKMATATGGKPIEAICHQTPRSGRPVITGPDYKDVTTDGSKLVNHQPLKPSKPERDTLWRDYSVGYRIANRPNHFVDQRAKATGHINTMKRVKTAKTV